MVESPTATDPAVPCKTRDHRYAMCKARSTIEGPRSPISALVTTIPIPDPRSTISRPPLPLPDPRPMAPNPRPAIHGPQAPVCDLRSTIPRAPSPDAQSTAPRRPIPGLRSKIPNLPCRRPRASVTATCAVAFQALAFPSAGRVHGIVLVILRLLAPSGERLPAKRAP